MLPKSPSMSSVEDDSDEELPCVTLSQSTRSKSDLEMPTASEVASLRAREDAAERALRDLRDSCNVPLLISLSRSASQGSSSSEGEAALSARVSALQVSEQPGDRGIKDHLEMLTAIRDNLPEESAILNEYIRVLKEKPERAEAVTKLILRGVRSSLISRRRPTDIGVCVCLLRAALRGRRGLGARGALHALLNARKDVSTLANAVSAAMEEPEQLLAVHDAARDGARGGADRLAAALLARAAARVLRQDTSPNTEPPAPFSPESVSLVRSSWRKLSTRAQLTLLRCAGRLLAAVGDNGDMDMGDNGDMDMGDNGDMDMRDKGDMDMADKGDMGTREAEREGLAALLAALSQPLPRASAFDVDRQQVLTNVSTLQQLFRSRFVPESEHDTFIETHFNCSQISVDSIDTPTKLEKLIKEESPFKEETPIQEDTPIHEETSINEEIQIKQETPIQEDTLIHEETSINEEIQIKQETPIQEDTPIHEETSINEEIQIKQETLIQEDTLIHQYTPIEEETHNQQQNLSTLRKNEIKVKIPMELVTPMRLDTPINMPDKLHPSINELPINQSLIKSPSVKDPPVNESPMKNPSMNYLPMNDAIVAIVKTPPIIDSDVKAPQISPPMNDSKIKWPPITPVKGMKSTQLKLDGYFKQITPVKVEKEVEERSPERKRIRRELPERRCAKRNGRS